MGALWWIEEDPDAMAWIFLLAAGCIEVAWALSIEPTAGFSRPWPTLRCAVLGVAAVYLLTRRGL